MVPSPYPRGPRPGRGAAGGGPDGGTRVREVDSTRGMPFADPVGDWTTTQLVLLALAALLVGFSKASIQGVGQVSVAVFAAVMPAKESTGALLPLLILGDVFAVAAYREHTRWGALLRLLPTVGIGIVLGTVFIAQVDDTTMRRTIGLVLLALIAVTLWVRRRPQDGVPVHGGLRGRAEAAGYGSLAGFTTMVANSGGPVMSLYLLSSRLPMLAFLGTAAWFLALLNVVKIPFSVGLGLITPESLLLDLALAPCVVVGALAGRRVVARLDQALFERLVLGFTVVAAVNLVL